MINWRVSEFHVLFVSSKGTFSPLTIPSPYSVFIWIFCLQCRNWVSDRPQSPNLSLLTWCKSPLRALDLNDKNLSNSNLFSVNLYIFWFCIIGNNENRIDLKFFVAACFYIHVIHIWHAGSLTASRSPVLLLGQVSLIYNRAGPCFSAHFTNLSHFEAKSAKQDNLVREFTNNPSLEASLHLLTSPPGSFITSCCCWKEEL